MKLNPASNDQDQGDVRPTQSEARDSSGTLMRDRLRRPGVGYGWVGSSLLTPPRSRARLNIIDQWTAQIARLLDDDIGHPGFQRLDCRKASSRLGWNCTSNAGVRELPEKRRLSADGDLIRAYETGFERSTA
jgi:hypothetical protein